MEARRRTEILPFWGADGRPEQRPGALRESEPQPLPGAHWDEPAHQPSGGAGLVPGQRDRETPVFSSALPPAGLSGALRRAAHRIPDHRLGHWMLLMLADRVDVIEHMSFGKKRREQRIPVE